MTHYYLAGPMRGYADFNHPAFYTAADALRTAGYTIVSPAEKDTADGFYLIGLDGTAEELTGIGFDIDVALSADIRVIADKECAGVICLEGWENSSGAKAETAFAWVTGRKVYRFFHPDRFNGFEYQLLPMKPPVIRPVFDETVDGITF